MLNLTVSTSQYQIFDITYAYLYMPAPERVSKDAVIVNGFYYAVGNYQLAPTMLAYEENFAVFAQ